MYPRNILLEMPLFVIRFTTLWMAVALILSMQARAQNNNLSPERYSVYYLVVGNGHYEQDPEKFNTSGFIPYDNLPEAIASAEIVTKFLRQYAHAKGITLLSSPDSLITRMRVGKKFEDVLNMMLRDSAENPMFVFYYCGHGLTDAVFSGQYLLPGDFTYVVSPNGLIDLYHKGYLRIEELPAKTIPVNNIVSAFRNVRMAYCVLLDCCRKESDRHKTDRFSELPLTELPEVTWKDDSNLKLLQDVNRNFFGEPVVFSSAYNEIAYLYDVPATSQAKQWAIESSLQIGPLCRRILLLLDQSHRNLTLNDFITLLKSPQSDKITPTPYSKFTPDSAYKNIIFLAPSLP